MKLEAFIMEFKGDKLIKTKIFYPSGDAIKEGDLLKINSDFVPAGIYLVSINNYRFILTNTRTGDHVGIDIFDFEAYEYLGSIYKSFLPVNYNPKYNKYLNGTVKDSSEEELLKELENTNYYIKR